MQNPRIYGWDLSANTVGLLIFAQRIEECLHDYTLDSYKAPALNTHTRCIELLQTVEDVRSGITMPKTLTPIIEELCDSLDHDLAAKVLLGESAKDMRNPQWWSSSDTRKLTVKAEYLRGILWKGSYERELRRQLEIRIPTGHDKEAIQDLAVNLVVEWVQMGFSQDFIYYRTRTFFFGVRRRIENATARLLEFFRSFEPTERSYDVCIRATASMSALQPVLPASVATISSTPPPKRSKLPREALFLEKTHSGTFVLVPSVSAFDARSAGQIALERLESIATVASYHLHRTELGWHRDLLVWEKNHPVVLKPSRLPIHKEDECSIGDLPARFRETIVALNPAKLPPESWTRIQSALNLHASAIGSQALAVQLTTLWSAIETLIPASADTGRIAEIVEVLGPILSSHYPRKIFSDLDDSLKRCVAASYDEAMKRTKTDAPRWLRCAEIIAIEANEPLRDLIYPDLDANPLLRYRVFATMKRFTDAEKVLGTIEAHRRKITWQIRRIYRTRNLLVHAGHSVPYRETLVENLHNYFHSLINSLEEIFGVDPSPNGVDAAFLMQRLNLDHHLARLREMKDTKASAENLTSLLADTTF